MTKKKYRRYSPEFKRHALKRASEDGMTDQGVCDDLGISARQLRRWPQDLGDGRCNRLTRERLFCSNRHQRLQRSRIA